LIDRPTIVRLLRPALASVLVAWALLDLAGYAAFWRRGTPEGDPVGRIDALLAPLRDELTDQRRIGLVTDRNEVGMLFRVQYALAPSLVVPLDPVPGLRAVDVRPEPSRVVGLFERPGSARLAAERHGLTPLRAFGPGVVLFGRER